VLSARTRLLSLLVFLAKPVVLGAQMAETRLDPAVASLNEEFGRIYTVRELADGRVLITDNSTSGRLVAADLVTGEVREIGRAGNGPGEYQHPAGRLIPLAADSTLFTSGARPPRWVLLSGSNIVGSAPPDSRAVLLAGNAVGADTLGNVLANRESGTIRRDGPYSVLRVSGVRVNRRTGRVDTIATMRGAEMSNRQVGTAAKPFMISTQVVFSTAEQSMLFADGWIAVVRIQPYHIEWVSPDGRRLLGPDLGWKPVKVDAREKQAYEARVSKRLGQKVDYSHAPWSASIPPIRQSPLLAGPEGNVWIARSLWSGMEDTRYDIVDRRGMLVGRVVMPTNERIVGFGKAVVYVAVSDDDGIERLRKHPWP
jgi:hypothetical protein